jgi:ribosome maturation factor RimP
MAQRRQDAATGSLREQLRTLVQPLVAAAELELESLSITRVGRRNLVRIVVDGERGVGHDELGVLSQRISICLDEAEAAGVVVGDGSYTLELSSPGVDRPLTTLAHWRRNVGRLVRVKAADRLVTGRIMAVTQPSATHPATVTLQVDAAATAQVVEFDQLGPGRVQVEFDGGAASRQEEDGA